MSELIKLTVATDLKEDSTEAFWQALSMFHRTDGLQLHVVYVLSDPGLNEIDEMATVLDDGKENVKKWVEKATKDYPGTAPAFNYFVHVRFGDIVETIQQVAVDYDTEAIVVGTRGRKGLSKLVLGSIAGDLVQRAHCSVIVARPNQLSTLPSTERPDPKREGEKLDSKRPERRHTYGPSEWRPSSPPTGFRIV